MIADLLQGEISRLASERGLDEQALRERLAPYESGVIWPPLTESDVVEALAFYLGAFVELWSEGARGSVRANLLLPAALADLAETAGLAGAAGLAHWAAAAARSSEPGLPAEPVGERLAKVAAACRRSGTLAPLIEIDSAWSSIQAWSAPVPAPEPTPETAPEEPPVEPEPAAEVEPEPVLESEPVEAPEPEPIVAADPEPIAAPTPQPPAQPLALLAAPSTIARTFLTRLLAQQGFAVHAMESDAALSAADCDLLLFDGSLPEGDLEQIWDAHPDLRSRTVVLTRDSGERERARRAGAVEVLASPPSEEELLHALGRLPRAGHH